MTTTQRDTLPARRSASAREAVHLPQLQRVAVALGMSLLLWLYVAAISENPQRIVYPSVPLGIRNPAQGLVVTNRLPMVSVETSALRGARSAEEVTPSAYIDLAGLPAGRHVVPVRVETIPDAQVTSIQPPQVPIVLEMAESAVVPVQVAPVGGESATASMQPPRPTPDQVAVTGPRNALEQVERALATVPLDTITPGRTISVPLQPVDRNGRRVLGVTVNPRVVSVTLPALPTATP